MAPRSRAPLRIQRPRLLLCEGKTTLLVLGPFCRHHGIQGFQPIDFGGKDDFAAFLADVSVLPGFAQVSHIAIVRDAEASMAGEFAKTVAALRACGLAEPPRAGGVAAGPPEVGVYLTPNNADPGMIETLCLHSVAQDAAMECLEDMFRCVERKLTALPRNLHKARAQAFLATREVVEPHVGYAAGEGVWDFDHEAFAPLAEFLRRLAGPAE